MKNIPLYSLFSFLIIALFFPSCRKGVGDFLDKAPGIDVTQDTIFSSKRQIETLVATMYRDGLPSTLPVKDSRTEGSNGANGVFQVSSGASDEGENVVPWTPNADWNHATITPTSIENHDFRYHIRWVAIREANTLLERIEEGRANAETSYLDQVSGEAKFIRAYAYFEMVKQYGGEPIIAKPLTSKDVLTTPIHRNSIEAVINFMVKDCDDAAAVLPDSYAPNMIGRATRGAALLLKSRILLYAASPLFNTANPYLSLGSSDSLICYTNYDVSRWQKAADAAKSVMDWANTAGVHLITDQGADKNYEYMWTTPDNGEIILANKFLGLQNQFGFPWYGLMPKVIFNAKYKAGLTVNFNFQMLYEKKDGTPQNWNMNGGNNLNEMYADLDPRFEQSIAYNGSFWNSDYPIVNIYEGGAQAADCWGGAWQRKFIPRSLRKNNDAVQSNNILMRLAEAYLNYAESINEANSSPPQEAYDAVNKIRNRSGMPDLPASLSKEDFRKRVRNERAVEFAFEDHRFWDIRRWLVAEQLIGGDMLGLRIKKIPNSNDFSYEVVKKTRTFLKKMYLNPFSYEEINKGYLIQNPGW